MGKFATIEHATRKNPIANATGNTRRRSAHSPAPAIATAASSPITATASRVSSRGTCRYE